MPPRSTTARPGGRPAASSAASSAGGATGPAPLAAVEKAIAVLDALGRAPEGVDLNGIAAQVGMSAPGAYRTLQTLLAGGLVTQDGKRGAYRLGPKVLVLARALQSEAALVSAAEPELRELSRTSGESVQLAVMRDRRLWVLVSVAGSGDVVARSRPPGTDVAPELHTTGRGKLFLAYLPEAEARALVKGTGLPKVGPNSITDETRLWKELAAARARGYATNRGERSPHLAGVAMPIFDVDGAILATIGITVPIFTLTPERESELARLGAETARRIEARLRGRHT